MRKYNNESFMGSQKYLRGLRIVPEGFRRFQGHFRGSQKRFKSAQGAPEEFHRVSKGFRWYQYIAGVYQRGSMTLQGVREISEAFERFQSHPRKFQAVPGAFQGVLEWL